MKNNPNKSFRTHEYTAVQVKTTKALLSSNIRNLLTDESRKILRNIMREKKHTGTLRWLTAGSHSPRKM